VHARDHHVPHSLYQVVQPDICQLCHPKGHARWVSHLPTAPADLEKMALTPLAMNIHILVSPYQITCRFHALFIHVLFLRQGLSKVCGEDYENFCSALQNGKLESITCSQKPSQPNSKGSQVQVPRFRTQMHHPMCRQSPPSLSRMLAELHTPESSVTSWFPTIM
jgi:hypothetical protein